MTLPKHDTLPGAIPGLSAKVLATRRSMHQLRIDAMYAKMRKVTDLPKIPSSPTIPDAKIILKQAKLIFEEMFELLEACGCTIHIKDYALMARTGAKLEHCDEELPLIHSELTVEWDGDTETNESTDKLDLEHIAKEIADLSVVTTGMFSELGISDIPILEEVDLNNLGKFGPGGYLDENRKWRKPPDYKAPDLKQVLVDQGWVPEGCDEKTKSDEAVLVSSDSAR